MQADDRQDTAEWVSSSSSSEDLVLPLRSMSFPNAVLMGVFRQEEVAPFRGLGKDTSLPVSVQSGLHGELWRAGRQQSPGLTLRQRFMQEQQQWATGAAALPADQPGSEPVDIWTALERQPSPVITLRQRFGQAQQQQLQQDIQRQGMQSSQAVLELSPEDIVLQEASPDQEQTALQGTGSALSAEEPGSPMVYQQSGLQPQLDGVSARRAARRLSQLKTAPATGFSESTDVVPEGNRAVGRSLSKLPSAMSSGSAGDADELASKGVRFGGAASPAQEQGSIQQAQPRLSLPRTKSSLKQHRSPPETLRRRSFRSSVSFAAVSTASDSSSETSDTSKSKAVVSSAASPLLKTASSVWAMITGGGGKSSTAPVAAYTPARTESRNYDDISKPPRPPPMASSRWQAASKKAAATVRQTPAKRPLSRFGTFFDVVVQETAAHGKPSLSRRLGQEHVQLGVRMLLEARESGSRLQSVRSEQGSAKHMAKAFSTASTVQVGAMLIWRQMTSVRPSTIHCIGV